MLNGVLFVYDQEKKLVAFKSGDLNSRRAVVMIGGLGDGFLTIPYMEPLSNECRSREFMFVQLLMESSYSGFGLKSLEADCHNLVKLTKCLVADHGIKEVHLIGHSTGCQDIAWLLTRFPNPPIDVIKTACLQAPVSDADFIKYAHQDMIAEFEKISPSLTDQNTVLPFTYFGHPITAYRFRSLAIHGNDDDFFSEGICTDKLVEAMNVPCMIVMSGKDEYIPPTFEPARLMAAFKAKTSLYLATSDHAISDEESQRQFIEAYFKFLLINSQDSDRP